MTLLSWVEVVGAVAGVIVIGQALAKRYAKDHRIDLLIKPVTYTQGIKDKYEAEAVRATAAKRRHHADEERRHAAKIDSGAESDERRKLRIA